MTLSGVVVCPWLNGFSFDTSAWNISDLSGADSRRESRGFAEVPPLRQLVRARHNLEKPLTALPVIARDGESLRYHRHRSGAGKDEAVSARTTRTALSWLLF
jgi:hypothetical protein